MKGKRNTGKVMGVRWDRFGWRFERTVWEREDGTRFIVVNGMENDLGEVMIGADDWYIV